MFKKVLSIAVLLTVNITTITSCLPGACSIDVEPPTYCVYINRTELSTYDELNDKELASGDSIRYNELSIRLYTSNEERSCYRPQQQLFGTTALACSKIPNYIVEDSVRNLEIFADKDFDDNHKAGDALNDLFSYDDINYLNNVNLNGLFNMNLEQAPKDVSAFVFYVRLTLASGTQVDAATTPIVLTKLR